MCALTDFCVCVCPHLCSADSLHGDSTSAQLSRLIWLYLHSGHQLYLEAVKGMVLECAHANLGFYQYQTEAHDHAQEHCAPHGGR